MKFNKIQSEIYERIEKLNNINSKVSFDDEIKIEIPTIFEKEVLSIAKALIPWRKGPFRINNTLIDSEWRSFIKFNLLKPHLNLKDKIVADVGCNNGYYMFRALEFSPKKIVGFDPSIHTFLQFKFINKLINSNIVYEILGVDELSSYKQKFDVIFCLGVLYHRSDPIKTLKNLKNSLNLNAEVILDTLYLEGDDEIALFPANSYAKMSNVYFIPTIKCLKNWCKRANFKEFEILATNKTTLDEQRKTEWINSQSLDDFLDFKNDLTIEGYPPLRRVYVRLKA